MNGNELISLDGCPDTVGGDFNCSGNKIKSLQNSPKSVKGEYNCSHNELNSLEGIGEIKKGLNCEYNRIATLKGGPIKIEKGDFICSYNQLINLEGAPFEVNGNFECKGNRINNIETTSLKKVSGFFDISKNAKDFTTDEIKAIIEVKDCGTFKIAKIKTKEMPTSESLILSNMSMTLIKKNIAEKPRATIKKFFKNDFIR